MIYFNFALQVFNKMRNFVITAKSAIERLAKLYKYERE